MSNRSKGNHFEEEFCQMMFEEGFWVHNMAQNKAGQPADVIAVKNGCSLLIDCKLCENFEFPFSRIEPNQRSAMDLWERCGNGRGWFALRLPNLSVRMISLPELDKLAMMGYRKLKYEEIMQWCISFHDWIGDIEYGD